MTPEELAPVWAAYWGSDPEDREVAREVLVRQFLPLANYLARQSLAKAPPHQDAEDIHSYAHHGLLDAIAKFRPDAGAKFETYATRRITGSIIDGQRSQDPLTRAGRRTVKAMTVVWGELWESLGREPTIAEIAVAADLEPAVVQRAMLDQQSMNASLDLLMDEHGSHREYGSTSEGEVELTAQMIEVRGFVAHRLARMGGRERALTLLHYIDELSMGETAERLQIGSDMCTRTRAGVLEAIRGVTGSRS